MPALAEVAREKLAALEAGARRRELTVSAHDDALTVTRGGRRLVSFSGNDYLGLSRHPRVKAAAIEATERYGTGAGASRLVTGNHPLYARLEERLAAWKGKESALVFGSGYLASSGIIPALVGRDDVILADRLVHACLLDGALLSGAKLQRFRHNDMQDLARLLAEHRARHRHCLIVTDEVFSMDGDVAPLARMRELADAHDAWLMADGAHSLSAAPPPVDVYVGTLSKAFGGYGGFVCGSRAITDYLATSARSFMFSTGLPPAVVASSLAGLEIITQEPDLLRAPVSKARLFAGAAGLARPESQIVPLVMGAERDALAASASLEGEGYLVAAIRPPTVPEHSSRLRFAFSALHEDSDVLKLAGLVKDRCRP